MNSQDIVKLNIGGVKYMTTVATLTSQSDNFFTALLKRDQPVQKDSDGEFVLTMLAFLWLFVQETSSLIATEFISHRC
jgi:hypothetical protein